jgi:hypothetical protein
MRRLISLVVALSFVMMGIGVFEASGQRAKRSAEWTPDPASLKGLGAAVAVEKYTVRVPKGYDLQRPNNAPPGVRIWGWTSAARRDGTKGSVTMNLLTLPAAEQAKFKSLTLEQLADRLIGGVKRQRTNWTQERTENGVINGMNFVRIRWKGTDPRRNAEMRGFAYVARDGDTIVQIASQDLMPETDKALSLAEASALTFKKN